MTDQGSESQAPTTAWGIVKKLYFHGQDLDARSFASKFGLDERYVQKIFAGEITALSHDFCVALGTALKQSPEIYECLSKLCETERATRT